MVPIELFFVNLFYQRLPIFYLLLLRQINTTKTIHIP